MRTVGYRDSFSSRLLGFRPSCSRAVILRMLAVTALIFTTSLCFFAPQCNALSSAKEGERIRKVVVEGNKLISDASIRKYLSIDPELLYDDIKLDSLLKRLYKKHLFTDIQISLDDGVLNIKVDENPGIQEVVIRGNTAVGDKILIKEMQLRSKGIYAPSKLQQDINMIKSIYSQMGYYNATVHAKKVQLNDHSIKLILDIDEGKVAQIRGITFHGNKSYSDFRLRFQIFSKVFNIFYWMYGQSSYSPEKVEYDKHLLTKFYRDHGYIDAQIVSSVAEVSTDKSAVFMHYTVSEGEQYYLDDPTLESNIKSMPDDDKVQKILNELKGTYFNQGYIDATKEKILNLLYKLGYAYAEVEISAIPNKETGKVAVICTINPSKKIYINKINIHNNYKTRDEAIRNRLLVQEGSCYNKELIKKSKHALEYIPGLEKVSIQTNTIDDDYVDLDVGVKEGKTIGLSLNASLPLEMSSGSTKKDGKEGEQHEENDDEKSFLKRLGRAFRAEGSFSDPNFLGTASNCEVSGNIGVSGWNTGASMTTQNYKYSSVGLRAFASQKFPEEESEESKKDSSQSNDSKAKAEGSTKNDSINLGPYRYGTLDSSWGGSIFMHNQFSERLSHGLSLSYVKGKREDRVSKDNKKQSSKKQISPLYEVGPYEKFTVGNSFTYRHYSSYLPDRRRGFELFGSGDITFANTSYAALKGGVAFTFPIYRRFLSSKIQVNGGRMWNLSGETFGDYKPFGDYRPIHIEDQFRHSYHGDFLIRDFYRVGPCDTTKKHNPLAATRFWTFSAQIHYKPEFLSVIGGSFFGFLDTGDAWDFNGADSYHDSKHGNLKYSDLVHNAPPPTETDSKESDNLLGNMLGYIPGKASIGVGVALPLPLFPRPISLTISTARKEDRDDLSDTDTMLGVIRFGLL